MITLDVCTGSVRINGERLGDSTVTSTFTLDKLASTQWETDASRTLKLLRDISSY
jgi:hypothetical protein